MWRLWEDRHFFRIWYISKSCSSIIITLKNLSTFDSLLNDPKVKGGYSKLSVDKLQFTSRGCSWSGHRTIIAWLRTDYRFDNFIFHRRDWKVTSFGIIFLVSRKWKKQTSSSLYFLWLEETNGFVGLCTVLFFRSRPLSFHICSLSVAFSTIRVFFILLKHLFFWCGQTTLV